jgi:hypothetical protein
MLNATLDFFNRDKTTQVKEVCRICRELAQLETERLCADCALIKARMRWHIRQQPADGDPKQELHCKRLGCLCPPCGRRIFDLHPFHSSDPAGAQGREVTDILIA